MEIIDDLKKDYFSPSRDCRFSLTQEVSKHMISQNYGEIINISSIAGEEGDFGQTNYSAAKAGVIGMTKTLSKELDKKGLM